MVERNAMKKTLILCLMSLMGLTGALRAQTDVELDPETGGRLSLKLNKKLSKGLHLTLEEEVRMDNNFSSLNRFHTTLGLTYKVLPDLKVGISYALINPYSASDAAFKSSRHRLQLEASYTYPLGDWNLSLKECFHATYRTGEMNEYQNPRTALVLKSRLKLTYKGWRRWEPYGYVEMRNTLNAPVVKANWDGTHYVTDGGSQSGAAGWFLDGFNGWYVNRWRGALGVEYRLSKASRVEMSLMVDWVTDKEVDANAEGTKLKSYTVESGLKGWLCASYSYSF